MSRIKTSFALVALLTALIATPFSFSQTIYATEFEEFEVGNDKLVGPDFWQIGNSIGTGSHGIDEDLVSGLGKSAFIGFNEPSTTLVTVAVTHAYDPVAEDNAIVEFESILGVEDSSTNQRDTFIVAFFNTPGDLLASIEFRNSNNQFGLWYSDGKKISDTDVDFIRGELHLLTAQIDFFNNTWSAQLDGIDLFSEVTFHDNGKVLDLGFTGAQWKLSSPQTSNHGDNFLLIADWFLQAPPTDVFDITSFTKAGTQDSISFPGEPGFIYFLEFSDDLLSWDRSPITPIQPEEISEFTFNAESPEERRFYRVVRDYAPPLSE